MSVTIDQFKRESARRKRGRRRGSAAYPDELRRFAVDYADATIGEGGSVSQVAGELGVSEATLAKWMEAADAIDDGPGGFREVVVERREAAAGALAVVTPSGLRVEGLDLAGAVALVRALG
jgi:transposase-like protein